MPAHLIASYESDYQRFLRLFEDIKLINVGSNLFVTPESWEVALEANWDWEPVFVVRKVDIRGSYRKTRCQWAHINQVEKRLIACGIDVDTAVDDKGRWVIRLTNVDGAESIDMIFSAQSEYFTKLEVNE